MSEASVSFDRLDAARIRGLGAVRVEVVDSIPSTNGELLARARAGRSIHALALFAEQQSAGRGRRGREWISPPGGNLYLSFGWHMRGTSLDGFSLAAGVAVLRALRTVAGVEAGLKWPNDIVADGRKLGGILVEVSGEAGALDAVVGIGLNLALPEAAAAEIGQPWTDLGRVCGHAIDRNALAAQLVAALAALAAEFEGAGFAASRAEWCRADVLRGCEVAVSGAGLDLFGTAAGVDDHGALLVLAEGILHTVTAGEVSVRARA